MQLSLTMTEQTEVDYVGSTAGSAVVSSVNTYRNRGYSALIRAPREPATLAAVKIAHRGVSAILNDISVFISAAVPMLLIRHTDCTTIRSDVGCGGNYAGVSSKCLSCFTQSS